MKSEELKKLKETFKQLQSKRNEVIELQKEINHLEKNEIVKRYLNLISLYEEKITGRNTGYDKYSDEDLISIALGKVDITPDEDIYVYIGTYKYNYEVDVIHGSYDIPVDRTNTDADYVEYENLESRYDGSIKIPYKEADNFEKNHKIIVPKNVLNREKYFYKLQKEYFEIMILDSPESALSKINKLIKK